MGSKVLDTSHPDPKSKLITLVKAPLTGSLVGDLIRSLIAYVLEPFKCIRNLSQNLFFWQEVPEEE